MEVVAIVQARMSSRRLPGKVLKEVKGVPILEYLLDRLRYLSSVRDIVVATSTHHTDDPIFEYCKNQVINCERGPLSDVAGRFLQVLERNSYFGFIRICADSPLINWELINLGLEFFKSKEFDIVTNKLHPTYPRGMAVEIIKTNVFKYGYKLMDHPDHFEHVTRYFYQNASDYKIKELLSLEDYSGLQFSVDCQEDFSFFEHVINMMDREPATYGLEDLLAIRNTLSTVDLSTA